MQFTHTFEVPAAIDQAWATLLDIPRIAGCLPGAAIDSRDGDDYTGRLKVKVGPISMAYGGVITLTEADETARRITLAGSGRDTHGAGTASATITATLSEAGTAATRVDVSTDFEVTGKPAQFGRGVLADVGGKLIDRFAASLAETMTDGPAGTRATSTGDGSSSGGGELSVVSIVAVPVLKRVLPALAVASAVTIGFALLRRGRKGHR